MVAAAGSCAAANIAADSASTASRLTFDVISVMTPPTTTAWRRGEIECPNKFSVVILEALNGGRPVVDSQFFLKQKRDAPAWLNLHARFRVLREQGFGARHVETHCDRSRIRRGRLQSDFP